MEATEVKDLIDEAVEREHEADKRSNTVTAIYIAILAVILAVVGTLGSNAGKDMMSNAIEASDSYAYYQSKTQRIISLRLAADQLDLLAAGLPDAARAAATAKAADYRAAADRNDVAGDPNGRPALLDRAHAAEKRRDHAAAQDPYYDLAEALLQIAIVLASVFVITGKTAIIWTSRALAALGVALAVDGITLLIPLPFL